MRNSLNKKKGFTLIELLVVIAIIGILAGIIFYAINPKTQTNKANDSTIKFAIDSMRIPITNYFAKNNYSYENASSDPKISEVILATPGMELKSDKNNWAIKGILYNGKEFCRDSSGNVSEKFNQDISDFKCD